jgi:hypothetical protein
LSINLALFFVKSVTEFAGENVGMMIARWQILVFSTISSRIEPHSVRYHSSQVGRVATLQAGVYQGFDAISPHS